MAGRGRHHRFTIYDMLEAKGVFESNPANADARGEDGSALYVGPVEYPKMFYHPTGAQREVSGARIEVNAAGQPITIPARFELIYEVAHDGEAEARLRAAGWHDHPAKAVAAGGGAAPPQSSADRIRELEAELARMKSAKVISHTATAKPPAMPKAESLAERLS